MFECFSLLHSLLGEGSITKQVATAVSHVYAACSSFQVMWELPPVEVVCMRNFHYVMEINSSALSSPIRNELEIELCSAGWSLERNKTYFVHLSAFSLSGKAVGSPWREEVTITPSGMISVQPGGTSNSFDVIAPDRSEDPLISMVYPHEHDPASNPSNFAIFEGTCV